MNDTYKHPFIKKLQKIASSDHYDAGALANLRRGLNDPTAAYRYVLPYLNEEEQKFNLDIYCLIGCLFALHQKSAQVGNIGDHMKKAAGENVEATERRFTDLLRAHKEDLPDKLRQAISFLKSKDVSINWEQLRKDLLNWDHEDGFVQKNWARGFWGYYKKEEGL